MEIFSSSTLTKLRGYVAFASWLAPAVGILGLIGWVFHIPLLRTALSGLVAIKANTTVCFMMLGISLWLQRKERGDGVTKNVARALAGVTAVVGLLTLAEIVFGWNLGIDQLLIRPTAEEALGSARPGLMSPVTAFNFVLLGLSLFLLDSDTKWRMWTTLFLCLGAEITSLFTLADVILNPYAFHTHISLQSAVTFCIFSLAPIAARPERLRAISTKELISDTLVGRLFSRGGEGWIAHWPLRYGVTILIVALAVLARHMPRSLLPAGLTYITFYPAVMIMATVGGFWPGVLATLLSALCADYFFLEPPGQFGDKSSSEMVGLILFTAVGTGISLFAGTLARTRKRAANRLQEQAMLLQQEVEASVRAKKEWELTFNTVSEPVMLLDDQQRILRANRATTELLGMGLGQIAGRHCYELVHQAHCPPANCPVQRMLKSGVAERGDIEEPRLDKIFDVVATPFKTAEGEFNGCVHVIRDVTERRRAEEQLQRVNRTLHALSECTEALMRAKDEAGMLQRVCDVAVQIGGYRMSWAGYAEDDEKKTVRPVASAGVEQGYLETANITWADVERGRGPTGTAIRTGKVVVCRDTTSDPNFAPWRAEAMKRGYRSAIMLPLRIENKVFGALNIYALEANAFDTREQRLLEELANNISHTVATLRARAERQHSQEQLREASLYTRSLIEASLDPLVTISKDGKIMDVNRATELATGVGRGTLIGSDFCEYFSQPDQARQGYQRVFSDGIVRDYALAIRHTSGRLIEVLYNASVFKNEAGEIQGVFAAARDITERRKAEDKLREQAALLDLAHDAILVRDLDNRVVFWSRGAKDTYGFPAEEAVGEITYLLLHTEFPLPLETIHSTMRERREWEGELRHIRRDGKHIVVASRWSLLRDDKGNPTAILEINRDITERKRTENQLRKASLYSRSLIEASVDPLVTISREGKITDVNQASERVTGVSREQLIGSDFSEYFTEPEQARRGYQEVFSTGSVRDYPLAIRHVSGGVTDVLYNASVFRSENGEVEGVFAAARDVTARKQAEEKVRRASLYTRSLIEASLDPLVTISREGRITDVNEATEAVTGISRDRLIGSDFSTYFTEPEKARAGYEQVFAEGFVQDYPLAIRHTTGRTTYVLYNANVFKNEGGEVEGVFAAARDITARKQAEEQVRTLNEELEQRVKQRTAELEAANRELEAFTYSVSHDLRAPLRHISGFSKILSEEFDSSLPEEAQHLLGRIQEGTHRMGTLVDDLLNLARVGRQEIRLQVTGLNSLVEEVIASLKPEYEGRQVEWKVGSLPFVECDAGLMKQVLQNLLSNALKFTRPRPVAVIEVGQIEKQGTPAVFVRDNGVGFSMKYADKLFGVFQRLHRPEDFEGTGVGLATVQRILHKHGGRIWAQSELDRGTTFYFTLPVSKAIEQNAEVAVVGGGS
jgi:PAS domain S-box-containing protein